MEESIAKKLLARVLAYYQGIGEYDFSSITDEQEKANAQYDAWHAIVNEIEYYLSTSKK